MSKKQKRRQRVVLLGLLVALLGLIVVDLQSGYANISLTQIGEILSGRASRALTYTFLELRMPRIVVSLLVGVGLSVSGMLMQSVTRNEMADPGLLGMNAGSGLLLAVFFVFFKQSVDRFSFWLPVLSFAGALGVFGLEYRLALVRQKMYPKRLLLMGVAISLALSSLTTMLMLRLPDQDYAFVQNWLAGNIWGASWGNAALLTVGFVPLLGVAFYGAKTLNLFDLGEIPATALGVDVKRQTKKFLLAAIALSSLCCAVGGGLSFVGLICPHLARKLVGVNHRVLVIGSVLLGGVLLTGADIVSRTLLLPNEIPVGIVATVLGAPYFLYLLVKEK